MYIDFDEYPPYSDTISEMFVTIFNTNIKCNHGYSYSQRKKKMCTWVHEENWEMMKNCFSDAKQIKKR